MFGGKIRRKKMEKIKVDKQNINNTVGFTRVENYDGQVTRIGMERATELANLFRCLENFDFDSVEIGVKDNYPLMVFLDDNRKTAFAIAPRINAED